ncbi:MAG: hypothetical protein FWE36_00385 [Erysipelotrichales bacterium]|nr:hypothetical protein [Erysipelotrichales bacterium]
MRRTLIFTLGLLIVILGLIRVYSFWAEGVNPPEDSGANSEIGIGQGFLEHEVGDIFQVGDIDWIIVYIDDNNNALIMTVDVYGAGTPFHNGSSFVHLPDTSHLRNALNNWWVNVDPLLKVRAVQTNGLNQDVRNNPGNWNSNELGVQGLTTAGTNQGVAEDLFILSISEVNRFYGIGINQAERIAYGYHATSNNFEPLIWWMRSPGSGVGGQALGSGVLANGGLNNDFYGSWRNGRADIGFRPALWIRLII